MSPSVRRALPPPPGEWHPAYADRADLAEWLRRGQPEPHPPLTHGRTILRRRAWGAAPFVGRPFCYVWWVGTDDLNRQITSEATIRYLDE